MIFPFNRQHPQWLWWIILAWCLLLLVFYLHGTSGTLFYDDFRPLNKLAEIERLWSEQAIFFVVGETSGPLGRPLAMLSFLPHFDGWPETLPSLLRVSVLIHFFNGLLVFVLTRQLLALRPVPMALPPWGLAAIAAVLWLTLPIHAAAVLIPIQRMAILTTTFVLLGAVGYVAGLQMQIRGHQRSTDVQLAAVVCGLTLAVLTKENGALLVVLLLVIELTLLSGVPEVRRYRGVRVGLLALASLAIVGFVLWQLLDKPLTTFSGRDFSALERLATQPLVILDYLRQSFVPQWQTINPFQDHWQALDLAQFWGLPGLAALVLLSWLVIAIVARRQWPWFAFGTLWFFGAQLLESTTLNLELSFLHRAYLPLVGLSLLLAVGGGQLLTWTTDKRRPLIALILAAYCGALGLTLAAVTSNWGNPEQAAQVWFEARPASNRAAVYLAKQLIEQKQHAAALAVIDRHMDRCPDCINARSWALMLACHTGNNAKVRQHFAELLARAQQGAHMKSITRNIEIYHGLLKKQHCTPGTEYTAYALLEQLIDIRSTGELRMQLSRLHIIDANTARIMQTP